MRLRLLPVVCMAAAAIAGGRGRSGVAAEPAKGARLKVELNAKGVSALHYGTTNLLADGTFAVEKAVLRRRDGTDTDAPLKADVRWDARRRALAFRYPWGSVTCDYGVEPDRLKMHVTVTNDSPDTLQGLSLRPLLVRFPAVPKGWDPKGHPHMDFLPGSPRVHVADFGTGALAFTNDDVTTPLIGGFRWASDPATHTYPVILWSSNFGWPDDAVTPRMIRPVPSRGRDEYSVSLRFGPSGSTGPRLAADLYRNFVKAYPYRIRWSDRRPIGALFVSTSEPKFQSETNPRGWLLDPKGIDVTTPAGRTAFKDRMLQWADASVAVLRKAGAQGSIVWDLEGQQYPHGVSYIGDPRSLPPEMDAIADDFFARLRADGLRTGVCVRPQLPVRPAYGNDVRQIDVTDPAQNLIEKIAYAKKRWGCSLFYVDSNGAPSAPLDDDVMDRVAAAHPDVLLVPEHETARYYSFSAPFHALDLGVTSTPAWVRDVYPEAFSVIFAPKDLAKKRGELAEAVRRGDVLLFVGWHETADTAEVRKIYGEAGRQ